MKINLTKTPPEATPEECASLIEHIADMIEHPGEQGLGDLMSEARLKLKHWLKLHNVADMYPDFQGLKRALKDVYEMEGGGGGYEVSVCNRIYETLDRRVSETVGYLRQLVEKVRAMEAESKSNTLKDWDNRDKSKNPENLGIDLTLLGGSKEGVEAKKLLQDLVRDLKLDADRKFNQSRINFNEEN